jgi:hypothetical protein
VADRNQELEELIALVESPGWQWIVSWARSEWGAEMYRTRVQGILGKITAAQSADASQHILQLESAARAIENLIGAPLERIKKLQAQEEKPRARAR